ncbi:probable histone-arginine methyltransferase 1.3, partial [Tanacetum coccineum]
MAAVVFRRGWGEGGGGDGVAVMGGVHGGRSRLDECWSGFAMGGDGGDGVLYRLGEAQSLCVSEGSESAKEAGAKHVYAVEVSEMADYAQKLIAGNPLLAQRITGKVEDVELPE